MRRRIRKFAQNTQTNKHTNKQTNKQRFQKQRPPYPLWSVDRRGTRANNEIVRISISTNDSTT